MESDAAGLRVGVMVVARRAFLSARHRAALLGDAPLIPLLRLLDDSLVTAAQIRVKGPSGELSVRVMEETVERTRIELSLKDHAKIDAEARINLTTLVDETDGCILVGDVGTVVLVDGVINASRRLEIDAPTAAKYGFADQTLVTAKLITERAKELSDVVVRVRPGPPLLCLDLAQATALNVDESTHATILASH